MTTKTFSSLSANKLKGIPTRRHLYALRPSRTVYRNVDDTSTSTQIEDFYNEKTAFAEQRIEDILIEQISSTLYSKEGDTSFPYPYPEPPFVLIISQFNLLKNIWKKETCHVSSITKKRDHWAYKQITDMGQKVVPLILKELEANPDYWFYALRKITGANPVSSESQGKTKEMTSAWLEWAHKHDISW